MIKVNPQVTELAAGYALIQDFLNTMRRQWLPGFEQSYQRRSKEYQIALEKYERRGLFLRTLLSKPKAPNRIPARYPGALESRLFQDWQGSFALTTGENDAAADQLDDRFLELAGLHLDSSRACEPLIIGPPGILIIRPHDDPGTSSSPHHPTMAGTRSAITSILERAALPEPVIEAGASGIWRDNLEDLVAANKLDPQTVYQMADALLARHQESDTARPFSARDSAEKLAAREKKNLLRMAATL